MGVGGGVAANVVPDHASVLINHRFAPDRTVEEAEASVRELLGAHLEPGDQLGAGRVRAGRPPGPGPPAPGRAGGGHRVAPAAKLGWTDVASFWAHGIPAANFGPGDPLLAHTPGEHVSTGQLERAATVLGTVLTAGG